MRDDQVTVVGFDGDNLGKTARRIAALVVRQAIFLNDRNTAVAHSGDDAVLGHAVLPGVPRDPDPLHASSMYSILGMCQSVNDRPFDAIALVSVRLCHVQTDPTDSCGGRYRAGQLPCASMDYRPRQVHVRPSGCLPEMSAVTAATSGRPDFATLSGGRA